MIDLPPMPATVTHCSIVNNDDRIPHVPCTVAVVSDPDGVFSVGYEVYGERFIFTGQKTGKRYVVQRLALTNNEPHMVGGLCRRENNVVTCVTVVQGVTLGVSATIR